MFCFDPVAEDESGALAVCVGYRHGYAGIIGLCRNFSAFLFRFRRLTLSVSVQYTMDTDTYGYIYGSEVDPHGYSADRSVFVRLFR